MKKQTKLRVLVLSLAMVATMLSPMTINAQSGGSDNFFKGGNDNYNNRGGVNIPGNDENGISNYGIGEEVPLGSGLLILTAVGAGYAISKRRRSYKTSKTYMSSGAFLLTLALILGFTSCKKNAETINTAASNGVFITLDVDGGNSGSKVIVNPNAPEGYATVTFEAGDVIYVGNNGAYCGYLEYNGSTSKFEGTVNPTSTADYLHFYFMGNKGEKSQPSSVNITDQTSKYPVISYAHSKTLYNSEVSTYKAKLQNYCAIVRFTTTNLNLPITIEGMNNTVTVDFGANNAAAATPTLDNNPYTFSKTGDGKITLHAESSTDRWAILLPQGAVTTAMAYADGYVSNGKISVPAIEANTYHGGTGGTGISVTMAAVQFSVGENTKVRFAPGNLQAVYASANNSTCTWQFASTQYSYIGNATANTAVGNNLVTTRGIVDLFGWVGENSSLPAYGVNNETDASKYGNTANESIKSDWGVVANDANLGGHNDWRTLTSGEWEYVLKTRNDGQKYGLGIVNGVYGMIILPDVWVLPDGLSSFNAGITPWTNSYTPAQWALMEKNGAVFLPAAYYRNGTTVEVQIQGIDRPRGYYWSSTSYTKKYAYSMYFYEDQLKCPYSILRSHGYSVRLVRVVVE